MAVVSCSAYFFKLIRAGTCRPLRPFHACLLALPALLLSGSVHALEFADVSVEAGFKPEFLADIPAGGIAVADFNGNGYPDIFVTGYYQPNRLFFNDGNGQFSDDKTINAQIAGSQCSVVAAADFDNDGWTDLYVGCRNQSNLLLRNLAGQGFDNLMVAAADHAATGSHPPRTDAVAWGDLTGNGFLDLFIGVYPTSSNPDLDNPDNLDRIVLNHGDGNWTNIALNFDGSDRAKLSRTALAVAISDLDGNGRPDIYVVNDKLQGNVLWRNDGPGCDGWCFSDIAPQVGADTAVFGMGIAIGDVNRNGLWDLYFSSIDTQVLLRGISSDPLLFEHDTETVLDHLGVGWATIFADFDNDGWEDAFLAVNSGSFSTSSTVDQLFRNQGDGSFVSVTADTVFDVVRPTEAAAVIDFNMDGRLDMVLGHWNQSPGYRLYQNLSQQTGNWIGFRLEGGGPVNRGAIGTRVVIETRNEAPQMRELRAGESRGSSHQPILHFGLGTHEQAKATIIWPDGLTETIEELPAGQYHFRQYPGQDVVFQDTFLNTH